MKLLSLFLFIFLAGCATKPEPQASGPVLRITEISPNKWTAITRQNLEHLLGVYDLSPIIFTEDISIQSRVVPHSHPSLTLNTRYAEQPNKLLAAFMHEQLHWWTLKNKANMARASKDLKKIIPKLPAKVNYDHVVVCFLEYDGLIYYLGKKEAYKVIRGFILQDKLHPWIYAEVVKRYKQIDRIILKHKLKPAPFYQNPTKKPPLS